MQNFELPKLYPITDKRLANLSHAAQVEKFIAGGARFIQLREKHLSPREFYQDAALAVEIARANNAQVIINDRVDIALALRADGVHLGQDDLPPEHARKILGESAIIGFSTHSLEQAIEAIEKPVDYIAIGPVFQTSTKENPDDVVGIEGVRNVRAKIGDFPLVAIGGITGETARFVIEAGADSVAVIGALLKKRDEIAAQTEFFVKYLTF